MSEVEKPKLSHITDAVIQEFDPNELLLGYQKRWIEDDSVLKIAEKSRRTGLTFAEAADSALSAGSAKGEGGSNVFYVGSNKEMAREFIDAVALWAKAFNKAAGEVQEEVLTNEDKDILTFVVYFDSGFKVQALSSNPSNLRGMQGTVIIDEAAFHDRLAEVLKAALALTMWGAKVRLISTHNGVANLFNQLIQDSRAGKKRYSVHTITLDDACVEGLYKRICQVQKVKWNQEKEDEWKANLLKDTATEDDALEEYYCVPKASSGQYIPIVLIGSAMKKGSPQLSIEAPKGFMEWHEGARELFVSQWCKSVLQPHIDRLEPTHSHAFGEDFARKGDLSIFVPLAERRDLSKYVPFYIELRNMTYKAQEQVLFYLLDRLPRRRGMAFDATGNGGYLAEAAALRFGTEVVDQVQLNDPWYREWMPKLKDQFESQNIDIPRNEDVRGDLCHIQVINGVPKIDKGKTKGQDGKQRHGDFAVALAMAERASWMEGSAIEFTPLPSKAEIQDNDDLYSDYHAFDQGCY
ncbi:terminase large subunit domain-containing protein [Photobacterium sanguinicancri]|uniref:terminase large subunit domain-containing protein n=1 Tax=Photobacterium sanguinicancri TaxID=875932 RepID=UPI0026E29F7D|nr:terminase family protein [Photobacterium sanguinicancri]MDO6497339.1 terminase family protein [Photobacterium sanguinicancri]